MVVQHEMKAGGVGNTSQGAAGPNTSAGRSFTGFLLRLQVPGGLLHGARRAFRAQAQRRRPRLRRLPRWCRRTRHRRPASIRNCRSKLFRYLRSGQYMPFLCNRTLQRTDVCKVLQLVESYAFPPLPNCDDSVCVTWPGLAQRLTWLVAERPGWTEQNKVMQCKVAMPMRSSSPGGARLADRPSAGLAAATPLRRPRRVAAAGTGAQQPGPVPVVVLCGKDNSHLTADLSHGWHWRRPPKEALEVTFCP